MPTLKVPVTPEDHIQGNENALITLVEYGDYQCPHCRLSYPIIQQIQKHFDKQLRFIFRHFPMTQMHPFAEIAAEAAEFAAAKGCFWQAHALIYEYQGNLSIPFLMGLAETLKLPSVDLQLALEKKIYETKIRSDFMGGIQSGVNGTPTFFINDNRYDGNFEFADVVSVINSILAR